MGLFPRVRPAWVSIGAVFWFESVQGLWAWLRSLLSAGVLVSLPSGVVGVTMSGWSVDSIDLARLNSMSTFLSQAHGVLVSADRASSVVRGPGWGLMRIASWRSE